MGKPFWLSVFCVVLLSFESNGQGDEEGWRHEGHEEGDEGEGGSASCGQASCEASQEEGHEEGDEGSVESEEGLNELSMTPLEGQPLFKAVGSALSNLRGPAGIYSTCTFEVCV